MPTAYVILEAVDEDTYRVLGVREAREPELAGRALLAAREPRERSGRLAGVPVSNWHEWDEVTEVDVRSTSTRVDATWKPAQPEPGPEPAAEAPSESPNGDGTLLGATA